MPDLNSLEAIVGSAKEGGVLTLVYKDLAQPGVRQVGKALETVMQLGTNLLLPLRLLNETARKFEERKFDDIAKRFSEIPDEDIIEISPEIGSPALERLSHTDDPTLREMFIELLAKASTASQVGLAHPSFVGVISSLSPDEAILLRYLRTKTLHPFVSVEARVVGKAELSTLADMVFLPPEGILYKENIPLYLSNLSGLGLIEFRRGTKLTAEGSYDNTESYCKESFPFPEKIMIGDEERSVVIKRHIIATLPYGISFITACMDKN